MCTRWRQLATAAAVSFVAIVAGARPVPERPAPLGALARPADVAAPTLVGEAAATASAPALAATPPTSATTAEVAPGVLVATSPLATRAMRLISYPWTRLGYQLSFHGPKAGFLGLTDCHTHHIDIYVSLGQSVTQVAYITAFEIGHAIDCANVVAGHQTRWPALRGFRLNGPWFPSCSCAEDNFASGDYAEVFARWQVGPVYRWRSTLAPVPTPVQLAVLIGLFG